jgi:hypothetical protein
MGTHYRTKAVEVEAVRFLASDYGEPLRFNETPEWLQSALDERRAWGAVKGEDYWYLAVGEYGAPGEHQVLAPGDWLILGPDGELSGCSPDRFADLYEARRDPGTRVMTDRGALVVTVIQSGLDGTLVRWFETYSHAHEGRPFLAVSKNGVRVHGWLDRIPEAALELAHEANRTLKRNPRADVSAYATHEVVRGDLIAIKRPAPVETTGGAA